MTFAIALISGLLALVLVLALALPSINGPTPSQCPGTARSSASAGRSAMLIMSGRTRFLRWAPWRLG